MELPVTIFSQLELSTIFSWMLAALGLGAVIFVHELGHFAVAKWCGVKCEKFYLGFDIYGLKLLKFQYGETEYGIGILPLGGYVKMLGQDDNPARAAEEAERCRLAGTEEDAAAQPALDPRSYLAKSVPQRMAIISAGVIMNVIFAFVVATLAYGLGVRYWPSQVSSVSPGDVAWTKDLRPGDKILEIDGIQNPRMDIDVMNRIALANLDHGIELTLQRPGVEEPIHLVLRPTKAEDALRPTVGINIVPASNRVGFAKDTTARTPAYHTEPPLKNNDAIVAINGQKANEYYQIAGILAQHPGEPLTLTVERKVEKSDKSASAAAKADQQATEKQATEQQLDVVIAPQPVRHLGLQMEMGQITAVQDNSPASAAGVLPGDRITAIDGQSPGDPMTLDERLRLRAGERITLTVRRPGSETPLEIPVTLRPVTWVETFIMNRTPVTVRALGVAYEVGNRIEAIEPNSPAALSKLSVGDEITEVRLVDTLAPKKDEKLSAEQRKAAQQRTKLLKDLLLHKPWELRGKEYVTWAFICAAMQTGVDHLDVELTTKSGTKVQLPLLESSEFFVPMRGLSFLPDFEIRRAGSFGEAIALGARECKDDLLMVYRFLQKLGAGQLSVKMLRGPGTIAVVAGSYADMGFPQLLIFLAALSANLAVINFLPIGVLDGGHMVLLIAEGIRGKPVNERLAERFQWAGLAFILMLMVFVITMDLSDFAGWLSR